MRKRIDKRNRCARTNTHTHLNLKRWIAQPNPLHRLTIAYRSWLDTHSGIFLYFVLCKMTPDQQQQQKKIKQKWWRETITFISIFTTVTYGSKKHGVRTVTVLCPITFHFILCMLFPFYTMLGLFAKNSANWTVHTHTKDSTKEKTHSHTHSTELKQNSRCIRHTSTIWECTHSTRMVLL